MSQKLIKSQSASKYQALEPLLMHQQFLVDNQYRRWVIPCRYSITVKDEYAIQNRLEIRNTLSQVSLGYIHDSKIYIQSYRISISAPHWIWWDIYFTFTLPKSSLTWLKSGKDRNVHLFFSTEKYRAYEQRPWPSISRRVSLRADRDYDRK